MLSDIAQILSLYQKAGVEVLCVYAISDKGRLDVQELNLTSGGIARLKRNRLGELNMRGEGIYFAPKIDTSAINGSFLILLFPPTIFSKHYQ
jgi:hypothetical protein